MCGIVGVFYPHLNNLDELKSATMRMMGTIAHRGPDDSGVWADARAGVALGFRRLAIVDLSPAGHQPMRSASGRFVLIFNGEVYNYRVLRRELEQKGARFRGTSDTEVILAAFEQWGIEASLKRFVGMFAIAVWDSVRGELSLARDRMGIKPLFVYHNRGVLTFGSELKALVAGPEFDRTVDTAAVESYLRYLYVPAPRSIYQHVFKLPPGHFLTIRDPMVVGPSTPFWSLPDVVEQGRSNPFVGTDEEAVTEFEQLLTEAVKLRMQADVPLGALLSGGIDSSTVVALMQAAADRPVKTYTIGFDQKEFDEASHARVIANHLGTDHHALHLTGGDALSVVPDLSDMFDEPLADPSQIPTYLVCQLARREVTVALTGDGGDELFAGYNRYIQGENLINAVQRWPVTLRRLSATGVKSLSPRAWNRARDMMRPVFPNAARTRLLGEKMHKMGDLLRSESPAAMYRSLLSAWQRPDLLVRERATGGALRDEMRDPTGQTLIDHMMFSDQTSYLPDDLLAKVDRASMAVSLEARVPILDHRVVEFAWRLPRHMKVRNGWGKWILRQVLYRHVPRSLVDREKMGFSVPLQKWLTGPLKEWAGDLLVSDAQDTVLCAPAARREWDRFVAGDSHNAAGIWALVMLRAWEKRWTAPAAAPVRRVLQA